MLELIFFVCLFFVLSVREKKTVSGHFHCIYSTSLFKVKSKCRFLSYHASSSSSSRQPSRHRHGSCDNFPASESYRHIIIFHSSHLSERLNKFRSTLSLLDTRIIIVNLSCHVHRTLNQPRLEYDLLKQHNSCIFCTGMNYFYYCIL